MIEGIEASGIKNLMMTVGKKGVKSVFEGNITGNDSSIILREAYKHPATPTRYRRAASNRMAVSIN